MKPLMNRVLLVMYCFILGYLTSLDTIFIIAFFTALSITAFNYYLDSKLFQIAATVIYGIFSCFFPGLLTFMPLISYDLFLSRSLLSWIPWVISFMLHAKDVQPLYMLFVLVGIAQAALLCYQTTSYDQLAEVYKRNRDDNIELNQVLKDKNRSIQEGQNYEIYTATLKERNRIAREIHDNVGHLLSRSILMTGALKAVNKDEAIKLQLGMLDDTLSQAMDSIRSSVHDLHDNSINLKESLDGLIAAFEFCDIIMNYDMQLDIPNDVKYSFISITKEALTNITRHSDATKVRVLVREHPSMYQLVIEDNGTNISHSMDTGIGLVNMRDRVEALKGNILIETKSGFRIFVTIPK